MQRWRGFLYLTYFVRFILLGCLIIAIFQNYILTEGTVYIFNIRLTQFYNHTDVRILPFSWVALYCIPTIQGIFKVKGKFYLSEFLMVSLITIDAFTHINGFYSMSFTLFSETIWFDKIMHFSEGVVLMLSIWPIILRFMNDNVKEIANPSAWAYWLTAAFVSIFFVVWEIVELIVDKLYGTTLITSRLDTNEDLSAAYLGFVIGVILIKLYKYLLKHYFKNLDNSGFMLK
jgi:hypothetical protein